MNSLDKRGALSCPSQPETAADFNSAWGGREELALEPCHAQLLGFNKSAGFILTQL